jgi:predicted Zn-dependent protease
MFRGTLDHAARPGPIPVSITVERGAVRAAGASGESAEIQLSALTLEPGGFDGDFVFCRPADRSFTISTGDPGLVEALRASGVPSLEPQLAKVGRHRESARRGVWISIGVAALFVGSIGLVLWNIPNMLAASVAALPLSIDRALGDAAFAAGDAGAPIEGSAARAVLEEIVARLAPHVSEPGHDFRVVVVENEEENAFALPGGRIVVFSGLIRAAGSAEEIAGILAHEMAHVTHRHGMRNLAHRAGIALALQLWLGDAEGWTELGAEAAILARESAYSREQEAEADEDAVRTLSGAGLDPLALNAFFRRMIATPGAESASLVTWISSHPDSASRIAHVEEVARGIAPGPRAPLRASFAAARAEVGVR